MGRLDITDEYTRKGLDTVFLENDDLRVEVLPGKGGDVTEIRDKRTDVNVLLKVPHEWRPPTAGQVGAPDPVAAFEDHYPGGWQSILPNGGGPSSAGPALAQHGESTIIPWEATIREETDRVAVEMHTALTRYPFELERTVSIHSGESRVNLREEATNTGEIPVEYSWLQHVALGEPVVGPAARLDVPCDRVLTDPAHDHENSRFPPGIEFDWPVWEEGDVNLQQFPEKDERVFDLVAFADLTEGAYSVTNPEIDLGVTVSFDESFYEYVWYWGAFGGHVDSPFFGRNYNVGLEPSTSIPTIGGLDAAIENGTANVIEPGETVEAAVSLETGRA